jgi:hypothetical protein
MAEEEAHQQALERLVTTTLGEGVATMGEDVGVEKEPSSQTDMQHDPLC